MGWVARDVAVRVRRQYGRFRWDQWAMFAERLKLRFTFAELPEWLPAYRHGDHIVLRWGMSIAETAWWAWHEIGHWLMHPGNCLHWMSVPWGQWVLSKHERQADEFARVFPNWDEHVALFLPMHLATPNVSGFTREQ